LKAIAAAKRATKQDRIKGELIGLPPMSRIKIRVSSGVFEVSLVRIIEETGSVEVLWDRGIKREFKWGSVIFGQTEGQTVVQKPSEPAPERESKVFPHPSCCSLVSCGLFRCECSPSSFDAGNSLSVDIGGCGVVVDYNTSD
jgi:hypothetical protein